MLEFKHPSMTNALSAIEFFHASTRAKLASSQTANTSVGNKKALSKRQGTKGIEAALVLPTLIFLGTEIFTPAETKPTEKTSMIVPEIIITLDADAQTAVELPAT